MSQQRCETPGPPPPLWVWRIWSWPKLDGSSRSSPDMHETNGTAAKTKAEFRQGSKYWRRKKQYLRWTFCRRTGSRIECEVKSAIQWLPPRFRLDVPSQALGCGQFHTGLTSRRSAGGGLSCPHCAGGENVKFRLIPDAVGERSSVCRGIPVRAECYREYTPIDFTSVAWRAVEGAGWYTPLMVGPRRVGGGHSRSGLVGSLGKV